MRAKQLVSAVLAVGILSQSGASQAQTIPAGVPPMPAVPSNISPSPSNPQPVPTPRPARQLLKGYLSHDESNIRTQLTQHPDDDEARFALGMVQFLHAVEGLSQDLYRYGVRLPSDIGVEAPFLRLPVRANPHPQAIDYHKARAIAQRMLDRLAQAQATLSEIKDPNVKLPVHFGMIRLDLLGDGKTEREPLWKLYARLMHRTFNAEEAEQFYIKFDGGDVHWLRAYCHLLMSILDVYLAYDSEETFNSTAQVFFSKVETPYPFLNDRRIRRDGQRWDFAQIADLVAMFHTIHWNVAEPQRMQYALSHLEQMVAQNKECWKCIQAETDDDHEWLPNPRQTGVIPGAQISQAMIDSWMRMMDELDLLLKGERLAPYWRASDGRGINVRKVFTEPRNLDLILWIQGTAAAPYLEHGKVTDEKVWRDIPDAFGDRLPTFAVWLN